MRAEDWLRGFALMVANADPADLTDTQRLQEVARGALDKAGNADGVTPRQDGLPPYRGG